MNTLVHRRPLFLSSLSAWFCLAPAWTGAAGLSAMDAVETAAIPVEAPARSSLIAIASASTRLVAVGEHGVIIYSDDYGASWVQADVPVSVTLTCIAFASARRGWAAGHFGVILVTEDAGKTWQLQLQGIQANQLTLLAAQQAAAQNIETVPTALAMARATHFVAEGADKPFLTLLALSPLKVIVFGAYRMAMMTDDGGRTWSDWSLQIYDRLSHDLYGSSAIGSAAYIVGEEGLIFRSTDGANIFRPVTPPQNVTLFGVIGETENLIIVFGVAGSCFRTTDQGRSWKPINLTSQLDITAGRVLHSGAILLADSAGNFYLSKDQGTNFRTISNIRPVATFDMVQAPNGNMVAVGSSGVRVLPAEYFN